MMAALRRIRFSTVAICMVAVACICIDLSLKNWEKQDRVIEHDIHWYYAYLPSTFIYNDLKEEKSDYHFDHDYYLFWPTTTPDGKKVTKTTMGLSVMYAPFFFVAHAYALFSDYPENGFSVPYKMFLLLSAIFYLVVGLGFLRKSLRHFGFADAHIAVTLLLLGLGSNLLCYASQSAPMPHVYNFCLFAVFLHCTIRWHARASVKNTIAIGLLLGLISLIRPSNALIILFFAFYNVYDLASFKERMAFLLKKSLLLALMVLLVFLVWLPQCIYWQEVTGHFIYYSYTDERFFFAHPHIAEGLFSFRKGWLIYTPMMLFPLIGLFIKDRLQRGLRFPTVLFTVLNIYIVFSWWCWWYGGTFGQRSLIDSYALLAIPFAVIVKTVAEKKTWLKAIFTFLCLFFVWLNIFQTYQYENLTLHWDSMTRELYVKQFGKMEKIANYDQYLSAPDIDAAKKGLPCETPDTSTPLANTPLKTNEKHIHIKAANGKFLCADESKKQVIYANRDNAGEWETFTIAYLENNNCSIRSSKGFYFSTELHEQTQITATRKEAYGWETFKLINNNDGSVSFKAVNNKYLSLDEKTMQLFATAKEIGRNEKFKLLKK